MITNFLSSEGGLKSGGTISGDVTISGDLTVTGGGGFTYSEVLTGNMSITRADAVTNPATDTNAGLLIENTNASGSAILRMRGGDGAARIMYGENNSTDKLYFSPRNEAANYVVLDHLGQMGIGTTSPTSPASVGKFLNIADAGSAGIVLEDTNAGDWEIYNASGILYFEDRGNSALALTLKNDKSAIFGGVTTLQSNNGNASHTLLKIHNNDETSNTETGQTADIEFNFQGTTNSGSSFVTKNAGAIRAGKDSDYFTSSADNMDSHLKFYTAQDNTNTLALTLDSSQNATFAGSVTSGNKYVIDGNTAANQKFQFHDDNVGLQRAGGSDRTANGNSLYISAFEDIVFTASGAAMGSQTERMRIADDGRVGIGREPVSWVHIDQTGAGTERGLYVYRDLASGSTDGELVFINNDNSGDDQPALRVKQDGTGDILVLDDGATRVLTVVDGGNVGIGTSSPIGGSSKTVLTISDSAQAVLVLEDTGYESSGDGLAMLAFNDGALAFRTASRSGTDFTGSTTQLILDANSRISLSNNDDGVSNTIFGKDAGDSNGAGDYNVFVGEKAGGTGTQTDDADYNVGLGYWALTDLTNGESNVAVGAFALENNTSGGANVAIGSWDSSTYQAPLTTNQVGSFNIAIGSGALRLANDDSVDGSIGIGYGALNEHVGNSSNARFANTAIAIGYKALLQMTSGSGNLAIGYSSGLNVTTGADNVGVGEKTLGGNSSTAITGDANTAVGWSAGANLEGAAANNSIFGKNAGYALTTGVDNTILGTQAADALLTGNKNVAIGRLALSSSQDADNCIAIGYAAMNANNDANSDGSIAIGYAAMNNLTTGAGNVGLGFEVMKQATTGKHNTSVGHQSMYNAMNVGDSNTAMGYQSLYSLDPDTDDHGSNTAVGKQSGYDVTTGTGNVLVGANAGNSGSNDLTTGDNNTYIGNEATGSAAGATNQTVVGALAVGQGNNSVTLGNTSVTEVYMAQDSGATVHAGGARIGSPTITGFATNIKASNDVLSLEADGTGGPQLRMTDTSSSSNDDTFGLIDFSAKDAGGTQLIMNRILNTVTDNNASSTDSQLSIYAMSNDTLTETVRIGSGRLYLPQGQIGFPTSQNASSDPNTLDDYEEGTWNPTFTTASGSVTADSSNNNAWYKKVGSIVHVGGRIGVSAISSPSGQIYITNLPFTPASDSESADLNSGSVILYNPSSDITGMVALEVAPSTGFLIREGGGLAGGVTALGAKFDTDTLVAFGITYTVSI